MKVTNWLRATLIGLIVIYSASSLSIETAEIPSDRILDAHELALLIKDGALPKKSRNARHNQKQLASYLRDLFNRRYFFNATDFETRFKQYNELFPAQKEIHYARTKAHMDLHPAKTPWKMPFKTLKTEPVTAYQFRHLSRQHKMLDIAFTHFYKQSDNSHILYFVDQVQSLNSAFISGDYEKVEDGNGTYEKFRAGYRVLNWLLVHNALMYETAYSDYDQINTVATLLHEGAVLYKNNQRFQNGNHQTRGVSALAMLAIIFSEFQGTDKWLEKAMQMLELHLDNEINADGFQFERSVHYHISDIHNYFYVYQLAKLNNVSISEDWSNKLRELFDTLIKISYPDKTAPVLQDDTDKPWSEYNDLSDIMTLGYLLFESPEYGYFSTGSVSSHMYWYIRSEQLKQLSAIETKAPSYRSLAFVDTGYYVMREGWKATDKMMIISAGLDDKKPDHQHGDMLGIQAYANGHILLPNYQVRYNLPDYELFKNSWVKSVALVDNIPQGQKYTSNKGGSGFGKFKKLPQPSVLAWGSNNDIDVFVGTHNGFDNVGVQYTRKIIYLRDEFWLVKDAFKSDESHEFQQVWQGHYTHEAAPELLRATFPDGAGFDIYQLTSVDKVSRNGKRGKLWSVVSKSKKGGTRFITALYPYHNYLNRIDETSANPVIGGWSINDKDIETSGKNAISLSKNNKAIIFDATGSNFSSASFVFPEESDFFLIKRDNVLFLQSLNGKDVLVKFGNPITVIKNNKKITAKEIILSPAETIAIPKVSRASDVSVIP